jgi:hypothetical protein
VSDPPKPDILRTMQIGMLDHLQTPQERLEEYNGILLSLPAYHDLTPITKSYEDVSQWNGKEMNEMSQYLIRVVTQSL